MDIKVTNDMQRNIENNKVLVITIDGLPHLRLSMNGMIGYKAEIDEQEDDHHHKKDVYKITYYYASRSVETEYDTQQKWEEILKQLMVLNV